MTETRAIETRDDLSFTVDVAGPEEGPLVLLLHGFPQSRAIWRHQLPALAATGHLAVAPDQRGYSPGTCTFSIRCPSGSVVKAARYGVAEL